MAGPESPIASPMITKMPVPMIAPRPSAVRSRVPTARLRPLSSFSSTTVSTSLVANSEPWPCARSFPSCSARKRLGYGLCMSEENEERTDVKQTARCLGGRRTAAARQPGDRSGSGRQGRRPAGARQGLLSVSPAPSSLASTPSGKSFRDVGLAARRGTQPRRPACRTPAHDQLCARRRGRRARSGRRPSRRRPRWTRPPSASSRSVCHSPKTPLVSSSQSAPGRRRLTALRLLGRRSTSPGAGSARSRRAGAALARRRRASSDARRAGRARSTNVSPRDVREREAGDEERRQVRRSTAR